ncbi:MAG: imidazole glycerol phosphate synthase subunit HisH [Actinobacteria bacterium]|nr:imidazole glycerol phosphate synthase subunit HisH [Actinomycetota bacterium]
MLVIVDYGMGNLRSVAKAFEHLGCPARISSSPADIDRADRLVLPGVGAFSDAMAALTSRSLAEPILSFIASGRPFLGICLGLQLLFDTSYEDGTHQGLGVWPGRSVRFDFSDHPESAGLKIPHMGWNTLAGQKDCPLFEGIPHNSYVYFVHSYYVVPDEKEITAAITEYGPVSFTSAAWKDNVFATQFHPEKSQRVGLKMLQNFVEF